MSSLITKFAHLQIPLEDVLKATNNFHHDNIISQGGFGPAYKGQLLRSRELIKITARRLDRKRGLGNSEFWNEVSMLSDLKHTNIVTIIGFCDEKGEKIIITTYEANGSLGQFLSSPNLTWTQRLRICVGVARGLSYLRYDEGRGYAVIHRFINNSTILLDEKWEAKLSGFEISIKQSVHQKDRVILCDPVGVIEYLDPEIEKNNGVTNKSDIYSFGVVLFEILCGREACIKNKANTFLVGKAKYHYENKTLKDIMYPDMWNQMSPHSLIKYSKLAYSCLNEERVQRPDAHYIVAELEKGLELQLRHENLGKKLEHLKISLSDIKKATNNFSQEHKTENGNHFAFYKADINHFDTEILLSEEQNIKGKYPKKHNTVVIKRYPLEHDNLCGEEQFFTEVEMLNVVKHRNIVSLLGYCAEGSEMILVTENVSNGYLSDYLSKVKEKGVLTWERRLKICIDVAHALNYLHFEMEDQKKTIINCDISSGTIGLDENFGAKIFEFGDSLFLPPNQEDEALFKQRFILSPCYGDPEYYATGRLKRESDVYSFGVLLFEVLCGRVAFDPVYKKESNEGLAHVVRQSFCTGTIEEMIDPMIKEETTENSVQLNRGPNKDSMHTFIEIAYQCVTQTQDQRPTTKVVIKALEKALIFQENNDNLRMSLEDVKLATQNFHVNNYIGGRESVRKLVYVGKVPQGSGFNTIVAKRFDTTLDQGECQFLNELQILSEYKHENIIDLVGYCAEKDEKIIVYEYASRRSLDRHLDDPSLTWVKRLNICIDVANALDFLHGGIGIKKEVIHRDINTKNILLNHDWKAKVADFRLSLTSSIDLEINYACYVNDHVSGTQGYLDPLYIESGLLSKESDVYSFGVVLFEILCGRSTHAVHKHVGHYLSDFIKTKFEEGKQDEVVFQQIKEQIVPESLFTFQKIAYQCLHHERKKRPTTKEVLVQLMKALKFQEERLECPNTDQVLNKLENLRLTHEIQVKKLEHLKILLSDIQTATDDFSDTYKIASLDGHTLYRAELEHFDKENPSSLKGKNEGEHPKRCNTVVMKRYPKGHDTYGEQQFFTEIEMLSSVKHRNIVTLLGFCFEGSEMILVIDNVSNGYLGDYLGKFENDKRRILTWEKRLKICIDVAYSLNYLHYEMEDQKMIINHDICSYGIGLDENWGAKIRDFWNSIFVPPNQEDKALNYIGIHRELYIDPEYIITNKLKRESDVYSFGVVLFEILCGRKANDPIYMKENNKGLTSVARQSFCEGTMEELIDPILKEEYCENNFVLKRGPNKDSLDIFIKIAYQCVTDFQDQRPTMKVVIKELEKAFSFQKNNKDNPKISLEDIKLATNNFHANNYIGGGGFGRVFIGTLQEGDGLKTIVAKRLDKRSDQGEKEFLTELQILLEYKHENVIGLVGYCNEKDEKIVVSNYAARGSLDTYLNDGSLTWVKRLSICIDVASALDFLHGGVGKHAKVIHRDIKSANILVDDDWKAKLADFGLSLISPLIQETDYVIDHACGTKGYVDPLYKKSGFLTIESDIYSFGVVLFELLCGRSTFAIKKHEGQYLPDFIKRRFEEGKHDEVVFKQIREQIMPKSLTTFQEVAYQCLHHEREKRPATKKVLMQLTKALEFQLNKQNMESTMTKFAHLKIPLEDVVKATDNFHDDNIVRRDRFGTTYIGRLLWSSTFMKIVARRFDCKNEERDLKFMTEISLKHTNLVSSIGFCDENDEKIIITTYETNGSLGQYLNSSNLSWMQRLRISVGMARALSYLHDEEGRDYSIIHCNINSDTILLDENWEAKLSGFEFFIKQSVYDKEQECLCEHINIMGCMDPAIEKTGGVNPKSDIYSFGVVLFEILCGRKTCIQEDGNRFLAPLVIHHYENGTLQDIIPHDLWNQMSPQSLWRYSRVAYSCLKEERAHRPNAHNIVNTLEKALKSHLQHENSGKKFQHLKIRLADIKLATHNFSEAYKSGNGDYYDSYRAELDLFQGHNTVIVRRFHPTDDEKGEEMFFTQLDMLTSVKHRGIVTLLGFCVEGPEMILAIEDHSYRPLSNYLGNVNYDKRRILTWKNRLKICIDVAHALNYLHYEMEDQKMIILRDINDSIIWLDEKWGAKIALFGCSKFLPLNQEDDSLCLSLIAKGYTWYYIDPEYNMTSKLNRKSDVYSFGVVLLEILCGREAKDPIYLKESDKGLAPLARQSFCTGTLENMIDPILKEETDENNCVFNKGPNKDSLHTFIKLALQCVAETQDQRPAMKIVVEELEKALKLQEDNTDNSRIALKKALAFQEKKFQHLDVRLADIKLATNNFAETYKVGVSDYFDSYRGLDLFQRQNVVIVRRFHPTDDGQGEQVFFTELNMLTSVKHHGIVTLLGFCVEGPEMILVIENTCSVSLSNYLLNVNDDKRRILTWERRLKICIDVAHAMDYLHSGMEDQKMIILRYLWSNDISLDRNCVAKIDSLQYSVLLPMNQADDSPCLSRIAHTHTRYYIDPEYKKTGKLKQESDVYSFGVVLLEILCGRVAEDPIYLKESDRGLAPLARRRFCMGKLEDMIDPILKEETDENNCALNRGPNKDSLHTFIEIVYKCVAESQDQRPTMKIVAVELEKALKLQENNTDNSRIALKKALAFQEKKFQHLKIRLADIKLATNNFSETYKIGASVYYALYRVGLDVFQRHNTVIVRRFHPTDDELGEHVFFTELYMFTSVKHRDIVTLLGFCVEGPEMILVFENNSSNGSLNYYLQNVNYDKRRILTWEKRLKICIDVAHVLDYLHSEMEDQKMIILRDLKTNNIALDGNWKAKIDWFGFSVLLPLNEEDDSLCHNRITDFYTRNYLDPEYKKTGKLKRESDVYSLGVVLLEIVCGRFAFDPIYLKESDKGLAHVARRSFCTGTLEDIIDPIIMEETRENNFVLKNRGPNNDSLQTFIEIALQCVVETQDQRPTMKIVVNELEKALFFQENSTENSRLPLKKALALRGLENFEIRLSDIKLATSNFSETYIIASGIGCTLYRAELDHFDKESPSSVQGKNKGQHPKRRSSVVIKQYPKEDHMYTEEFFFKEIEMLTNVEHPNIVTLLGFCVEGSEMIIVIENVSNGYLYDYLGNNTPCILTWEKRLKICIDAAHALSYLHSEMEDQKMIIHRDISSCSIGLGENWRAKIVDFWLSVFLPPNLEDEALYLVCRGKPSYTDPEYRMTNKLKRESDVYSFGVVLFEILSGRLAYDPIYTKESDIGLAFVARQSFRTGTLAYIIDPMLKDETGNPNKDSLDTFIEIAHQCVAETQDQRPTMELVVKELEKALSFQENKDYSRIPLEDIRLATQNFHDDNCIGGEGFWKVYKGNLQYGDGVNTIVAKRLDMRIGQGGKQFFSELQILREYKHENVIGLVGYCDEKDEKIIVYEYASKGSLDRYLNDASLTWMKRLNICIHIASALDFIHGGVGNQAKVIHRDIKTASILLNDDWKAKLADFGLSLITPLVQDTDYVIDRACGTRGYLDPLYYKSGFLTIESDIYSFGVVLFEILCGRSTFAFQNHEGDYLPDFIKRIFEEGKHDEVVFKLIRDQVMPKSLTTFQEIAYQCLHHEREKRPTTKKVLMKLKKALEFQSMPSRMTKFAPLQIPLGDVVMATNNFHDDKIIVHGGFCTAYKGKLLLSGRLTKIVARRFDSKHGEGDLKFLTELSIISDLKNANLVSFVGFCDEKDEKIILITYEANGSLRQYLNSSNLTWTQRLRICVHLGRALSYLHDDEGRDYSIIHCNINSDTVLLDENWEAKLSGFEVSIKKSIHDKEQECLCEHINIMGYMDPTIEKTGAVTHKSDIYSLGVVLFEILCGRKAFIHNEANRFLAPLAIHHYENGTLQDIIHHDLWNQMSPQSLLKYSRVAYSCLKEGRAHRPNAHNITNTLEEALESHLQHEQSGKELQHLHIRLSDIKSATNNFSETYKIASRDGEYTLYRAEVEHFDKENPSSIQGKNKGQHPKRRSTVVIKRYPRGHQIYGEEQFFTEIEILSSVTHPNVVTLLGYCVEGSEMILVTDNVSNGYLYNYLGNETPCILTWEKRLKICIDVAHALNYLHYEMEDQKVVINRDICSYNIGLDQNWGAKISEFGDCVFLPPNQEDEALFVKPKGRLSYIDPEYKMTNKLKRESDVYSFGVVLFEILSGRLAYDQIYKKESDIGLAFVAGQRFRTGTLAYITDPMLKDETSKPNKDSLDTFIEIAYQCLAETQDQRPTMKVVVNELEKSLSLQLSQLNPLDQTDDSADSVYCWPCRFWLRHLLGQRF